MRTIKYLGFYAGNNLLGERVFTPSVTNKMNYIVEALNQAGFSSWIISPVNVLSKKFKFDKGFTTVLNNNCKATYFDSIYGDNVIFKFFGKIIIMFQLILFLLRNVKSGEKILVYHHPLFFVPLFLCKKIKNITIILEVEEIYQNIWPINFLERISENLLLKLSDQYIVVSETLASKFPEKSKIIMHGNYIQYSCLSNKSVKHNSVNILYAGSIDKIRNAAFYAAECSELLPDNYVMNICGYGNDSDIKDILNLIDSINKKVGIEKCVFHGLLLGDDYKKLLQNCDIALNIQKNYDGIQYSLPSKIIAYLSANLKVITSRLESLHNSPFSSYFEFIDDYSPEGIADVIKKIDLSRNTSARELMEELHLNVCKKLNILFS